MSLTILQKKVSVVLAPLAAFTSFHLLSFPPARPPTLTPIPIVRHGTLTRTPTQLFRAWVEGVGTLRVQGRVQDEVRLDGVLQVPACIPGASVHWRSSYIHHTGERVLQYLLYLERCQHPILFLLFLPLFLPLTLADFAALLSVLSVLYAGD